LTGGGDRKDREKRKRGESDIIREADLEREGFSRERRERKKRVKERAKGAGSEGC